MALGSNQVTTSVANNFIPELWSDEVIGAYKSNLVVANLVTKLSHNCLLYTSPSPRDATLSRMPSSA